MKGVIVRSEETAHRLSRYFTPHHVLTVVKFRGNLQPVESKAATAPEQGSSIQHCPSEMDNKHRYFASRL